MSVSSNELGELLIDLGLITSEQLSDAIVQQEASGTRLSVVLSEMGLITERQLKDALELQYGVNFVNLSSAPPEAEYVQLVPEDIERQYRFVPVTKQGNQYTVAMVDPDDLVAADAVRQYLNSGNFKKLVCTADDFEHLMYLTYEKPPEPAEETLHALEDNHHEIGTPMSPRASQTKMKAAMRNLFESDDDDLDSMFGGVDENSASDVSAAEVPTPAKSKGSTKKKLSKKITSLFNDDDDDDDFGDVSDGASEEAPAATAQPDLNEIGQQDASSDAPPVESLLGSRLDELAAEVPEVTPEQEETMPSNQLLEHILQEAGVPQSKPKKTTKPKKKSMQSLFDDDDDDMDFGSASESEPAQPSEETEPAAALLAPTVDEQAQDLEQLPGLEQSLDSEHLDSEAIDQIGRFEQISTNEFGLSQKDEFAFESAESAVDETPVDTTSGQRRASAPSKAFRSLFDDEMDEDDLFGNEPLSDSLTPEVESLAEPEQELAPSMVPDETAESSEPAQSDEVAEVSETFETAETDVSETAETAETAESLLRAIERPFQSLFNDDEDDEDLFRGNELTVSTSLDEQVHESAEGVEAEPSGFDSEVGFDTAAGYEPASGLETADAAEPESSHSQELQMEAPEAADETQPAVQGDERVEFEEIKPAYHASFDDEMDEDSLFASASHPIPEGAPHLRDLLSRFDDSDSAFDALEDSMKQQQQPEGADEKPEPPAADVEDAELAVSALIAALDEQVPDEEISIPPRHPQAEDEANAPAESPAPHKVAQPKSKKLRALMMDDDDDTFGEPHPSSTEAEPVAETVSAAALSPTELESGASQAVEPQVEFQSTTEQQLEPEAEERVEFEEILPLDKEDLMPLSTATSELPPVVVSRAAKTMTQGTGAHVESPAQVAGQSGAVAIEPAAPFAESVVPPAAEFSAADQFSTPTLPEAAELPDALEDVLSNVTSELIDNAELANLSGNRTEISFLEEIVESELSLDDQIAAQRQVEESTQAQPQPTVAQATAAVSQQAAPQPAPQATPPTPAVQETIPQPAAQEPAPQAVPQAQPPQPAPPTEPPQAVPPQNAQPQPVAAQTAQDAPPAMPDETLQVSQSAVEQLNLDPSILNLATQILTQAVNSPCSDVHFEPLADGLALRFMSDGDLLDETILPAQIQGMLILCLKSMAGLDPKISDRPQDKKFVTRTFGDPVEMRITSIPGMHGEMVAVSLKS